MNVGIFKGEIGVLHGTADQTKSLTVAKGLSTYDVAVNEGQIFGIPSEVFASNLAVANAQVLGMPKGILGVEDAILDRSVFYVLKGVFSLHT